MSRAATADTVDKFLTFYRRYYDDRDNDTTGSTAILKLADRYPGDQTALEIDWSDLYNYDAALADDVLESPDEMLDLAEEALGLYDVPVDKDLSGANVRLVNLPEDAQCTPKEVSDEDAQKLRAIQGQVNKRSQRRGRFVSIVFECERCGTRTTVIQNGEDRQNPHECQGCERQGPFRPLKDKSETINDQLIRVQLPPEKSTGRSNATLDLRLEEDLVNTVEPGDRVTVNGVLEREFRSDESTLYDFTSTANSIEIQETDFEDIEYDEHLDEIREIAANNPFEKIRESIAPTIHGYDLYKTAIGLQMFGGTRKELPDGSIERGDSHILLVGDPGTAKSELLGFANKMAPRSVFTDGKGSTSAGLTASAVRDDFGDSEWTIVGGSLVKAHKGLACVDELDDMDEEDRASMNTVLEKQEVPVSKAGITATLPAQTTLLAAANPKHGRFDHYDAIPEQINLDPTLVSRFDLIFTFRDIPDPDEDREIISQKADVAEAGQKLAANQTLDDDLADAVEPEIDPEVMRAYIAYAQQKITPVFTEAAKERVKDVFFDLRQANADAEVDPEEQAVPVTYRKQEAIHRLAEASARVRLSNEIEVEDVDRVIEMVRKSLKDVGLDPETGDFDADVIETGSSKSQTQRLQFIEEVIDELASGSEKGAPHEEVVGLGKTEGYTRQQIEHGIEKLLNNRTIYEPNSDHYRVSL